MELAIKRIMVPLAGSSYDQEVVTLAAELAKRHRASLYAVHVIEVKPAFPLDADLPAEVSRSEAVLEPVEKWAKDAGMKVETDLLQARSAGAAITDEAIERNIDLILIPVPYKKKSGEFHLGSTVEFVLKHAPCRTWICREAMG